MKKKNNVAEICKNFQKAMQKIVKKDKGIDSISIQTEDNEPIVIAKKIKETDYANRSLPERV